MTVNYLTINSLEEISFIGGTEYTLEYVVYDQSGALANISGATCSAVISEYGNPDVLLTYAGNKTSATTFEVVFLSADSKALSGKFIHQPIVVESGKEYRSQQGIINITSAIQ
jgi:hypothetical protein